MSKIQDCFPDNAEEDSMEEEIKRLAIQTAKAKRRGCPCYMNLCGDCQDAKQLLGLLGEWNPTPEEGTYERYKEIKRRWNDQLGNSLDNV